MDLYNSLVQSVITKAVTSYRLEQLAWKLSKAILKEVPTTTQHIWQEVLIERMFSPALSQYI